MAVDINHPPAGGFQNGGWYWDPTSGEARQYWNGQFGAPNTISNPGQVGYGQQVSQEVKNQSNPNGKGVAGAGQGSGDPVATTLASSYQKIIDTYTNKGQEFDSKNPFSFDEVLASKRTEVGARLDPYYSQTLNDYIRGVEVKRTRSLEDEKQILTDTTSDVTNFAGKTKDILDEAIRTSAEGAADSGLFFSGLSMRNEGQNVNSANTSLNDYTTGANRTMRNASLNTSRTLADLARESGQKTRDLNQEKYYNVESGALKETNLAQARRDLERNQYIGAPFSSASLSSLPSTLSNYI